MSRRKNNPKTKTQLGQPSLRDRREPGNLERSTAAVGPSGDLANPEDGDEDEDSDDQLVDFSYSSPGALPGTLRIPTDALPTEIFLISYNPEAVHTATIDHPEECRAIAPPDSVNWLDARGLGSEPP